MRFLPGLLVLVVSCAPDPAASVNVAGPPLDTGTDPACDEPDLPTWENWGEGFFVTWCQSCHAADAPQRYGAPEGMDFDTRADVVARKSTIADSVLARGVMPPGGGLSPRERAELEALLCSL